MLSCLLRADGMCSRLISEVECTSSMGQSATSCSVTSRWSRRGSQRWRRTLSWRKGSGGVYPRDRLSPIQTFYQVGHFWRVRCCRRARFDRLGTSWRSYEWGISQGWLQAPVISNWTHLVEEILAVRLRSPQVCFYPLTWMAAFSFQVWDLVIVSRRHTPTRTFWNPFWNISEARR